MKNKISLFITLIALFFFTNSCKNTTALQKNNTTNLPNTPLPSFYQLQSEGYQISPEWIIVPGNHIGKITAKTTYAQLQAIFGEKLLEDVQLADFQLNQFGNTATFCKALPFCKVFFVWKNTSKTTIDRVIINGISCHWATPEGLHLGMHLKRTAEINTQNISFPAFKEGEMLTEVTNWQNGIFQKYNNNLQIFFNFDATDELATLSIMEFMDKNQTYSSATPNIHNLNMGVAQMVIKLH